MLPGRVKDKSFKKLRGSLPSVLFQSVAFSPITWRSKVRIFHPSSFYKGSCVIAEPLLLPSWLFARITSDFVIFFVVSILNKLNHLFKKLYCFPHSITSSKVFAESLVTKMPRAKKKYDVFICHASEDKAFVQSLADSLKARGLKVWYYRFTLKLGDSLRRSIDEGLASSRFGIVVLSPNFFSEDKIWIQIELDGLRTLEVGGEIKLLPILHNVSHGDVKKYSATLGGKLAVSSAEGMTEVVDKIMKVVRRKSTKPFAVRGEERINARTSLSSNLPPRVRHFVGREHECQKAVEALLKPQPYVITGMAGIGKTSLAVEIAHRFKEETLLPGGVCWCNIGRDTGLEQTVQIVARQVGVTDIAQCYPEQRLRSLASHVRDHKALLVLDNVFDRKVLKSILRNFQDVAVLITTRVCDIPTDLIDPKTQQCDLAGLSADESQKLLIHVSGEDEAHLKNEEIAHLKAICKVMGHHPMAVTAAAAYKASRKVSFKAVQENLGTVLHGQAVSVEGSTTDEETVERLVRSNCDYLSDTSQIALRASSVFRSSFSTEAFNEVLQCSSLQFARAFLEELLEISLVNHVGDERFRLHDMTRRVAWRMLKDAGGRPVVTERYVKYYCSFVERVEATTNEFACESQNIFAAFEYSCEAGNASGCVNLMKALNTYMTGTTAEELDSDLQEATKLELLCELWQRCVDLCRNSASPLLSYALWRYSHSLRGVSKFPEAEKVLKEALQKAAKDHDTRTEAACLSSLATRLCRNKKPPKEAEALAKQGLKKAKKIGDVETEGMCLHCLGWIYVHQGRWKKAIDKFNEAIICRRAIGTTDEIVRSLAALGCCLTELGRFDEAKFAVEEGLDLATGVGNRMSIALCLFRLGSISDHLHQFEDALRYYERSLDIRKALGDTNSVGTCSHAIGYCKFHLGQYEEAEHFFQHSLKIKSKRDDARGMAPSLEFLARLAARSGDIKQAKAYAGKSLGLYRSLGSPQAGKVKKLLTELSIEE